MWRWGLQTGQAAAEVHPLRRAALPVETGCTPSSIAESAPEAMLRVMQRPLGGIAAHWSTMQRPSTALSMTSTRSLSKLIFRSPMPSARVGLRVHNSVTPERFLMQQQRARMSTDYAALKKQRHAKCSADHMILGLVLANVAVYFGWQKVQRYPPMQQKMLEHFTTSAKHLEEGRYHTLLTSVFSHGDLGHLFANMVSLYLFGTPICALLGKKRFLGIYLGSGILSSWATVYDQQRADRLAFNVGASGAVNSVTATSILLNPRATLFIFGVVPFPAFVTGTLFIGRDNFRIFQLLRKTITLQTKAQPSGSLVPCCHVSFGSRPHTLTK